MKFVSRTIATSLFALAFLSACSRGIDRPTGNYSGIDGSNLNPARVTAGIASTGDGILGGSWSSEGTAKDARLTGKFGWWSNEVILIVSTGDCLGEFRGTFEWKADDFRGHVGKNPVCPDRVYDFVLTKSKT